METKNHLPETPEIQPMPDSARLRRNMAAVLNGTGKIIETTGVVAGAVAGIGTRTVVRTTLSFIRHLFGR